MYLLSTYSVLNGYSLFSLTTSMPRPNVPERLIEEVESLHEARREYPANSFQEALATVIDMATEDPHGNARNMPNRDQYGNLREGHEISPPPDVDDDESNDGGNGE